MKTLIVCVGLAVIGCAPSGAPGDVETTPRLPDSGSGNSDPDPAVIVKIEPSDRMTNVRDSPIRVTVGHLVGGVDQAQLMALAGRVRLTTDEGETVPAKVEILPLASEDAFTVRVLTVSPERDLSSTWHRVVVDLSESEFEAHPGLLSDSPDIFYSRLFPDTKPLLRAARICFDIARPGTAEIRLDWSEPVNFVPSARNSESAPVTAAVDAVQCALVSNDAGEDIVATVFQFVCQGLPEAVTAFKVAIGGTIVSSSGRVAVLVDSDGQDARALTLNFDSAYSIGECKHWQLP